MGWVDSGNDVYITSGNVSVGTSSIGERLVVQGGSDTGILLKDSSGNNRGRLSPSGSQHGEFQLWNNSGTATTYLGGSGSSNNYLNGGNNVGIGTTIPSSSAKLHISGAGDEELRIESTGASGSATLRLKCPANRYSIIEMDEAGTAQGRIVYNHSADSMGLYTTATERLRIDSAGGVNLIGLKIKYVPIGNNTLSDAVAAMSDGDCLVLGSGTYTQSVAVAIPTSPLVTRFAIIGQGSGVTRIRYTANVKGIASTVGGSNDYRIRRATLTGFSMEYDSATTATEAGIELWGDSYNYIQDPGINIYDVAMYYFEGRNDCWTPCIRLVDARVFTLDRVYLRRQANANIGTGIQLESCLNGRIINSFIMCTNIGLNCIKAADTLIEQLDPKYGCEDITLAHSVIYKASKGVEFGYKCEFCKVDTTEFSDISMSAITENISSGTENGGFHQISNSYVDFNSSVNGGHLMYIRRRGTLIRGCTFNPQNATIRFNAITFDNTAGSPSADGILCTASDNLIRFSGYDGVGIYMNANYCKATGNVFESSQGSGADIYISSGKTGNLVTSNMIDNSISDNGTSTTLANNPTH